MVLSLILIDKYACLRKLNNNIMWNVKRWTDRKKKQAKYNKKINDVALSNFFLLFIQQPIKNKVITL